MSELEGEEVGYERHDLDRRFDDGIRGLIESREMMEANDDDDSIAAFNKSLIDLMKTVHDCQHQRRGIVNLRSSKEIRLWFVRHLRAILTQLESWDLQRSDEYIDIRSDYNIFCHGLTKDEIESPPTETPPVTPVTNGIASTSSTDDLLTIPPEHEDENLIPPEHEDEHLPTIPPVHEAAGSIRLASLSAGDVIVVQPRDGASFSAMVSSLSKDMITVKLKTPSCSSPFAYQRAITLERDASTTVTLALKHLIHVDQYKEAFGHSDMKYGDRPYFLRVCHATFGELVFGRQAYLQGKPVVIAGLIGYWSRKRLGVKVLCFVEESKSFMEVPLTKDMKLTNLEFAPDSTLKLIVSTLKAPACSGLFWNILKYTTLMVGVDSQTRSTRKADLRKSDLRYTSRISCRTNGTVPVALAMANPREWVNLIAPQSRSDLWAHIVLRLGVRYRHRLRVRPLPRRRPQPRRTQPRILQIIRVIRAMKLPI